MLLRRVGVGFGIVSVGVAMTLVSVAPAGASQRGGLCSLNKSNQKAELRATTAVTKAVESGNWAAAQKALLGAFSQEASAEQQAIAALSGAPSSVKAAGGVMIRFSGTEKKIIQSSTTLANFESAAEAASQNPKVLSAEKTLSSYFTSKCGPVTSTT
jgi:hypothetical protein